MSLRRKVRAEDGVRSRGSVERGGEEEGALRFGRREGDVFATWRAGLEGTEVL